jgi:hypothetical protein
MIQIYCIYPWNYHSKPHCTILENNPQAGLQWLTPVILATQEAAFRWIAVQSQPEQRVHKTLFQKIPLQKRAGGVTQGIGPEFKPQYCQKRKRKKIILKKIKNKLKWRKIHYLFSLEKN